MRCAWALLLGLLGVLTPGCLSGQKFHRTAWLQRVPFLQKPAPVEDLVVMYVALLEAPLGDRYINDELWTQVDEQVVALEHKPVLEDNGLRVAQVGGIIPTRLQGLLTSERSCITPRRLLLHAGDTTTLHLGPQQSECRFDVHQGGHVSAVELDKAQFNFQVKPTLTRDGRTKLHFTPQVQHGDTRWLPRPTKNASGVLAWEPHEERPTENYNALAWEVVLSPGEYVLVGARYDRPGTLGRQCFICPDPQAPVQRLLAIRTIRSVEAVVAASDEADDQDSTPRAAPLALQASLGGAGGR